VSVRVVYSDLDGTMVGPAGCFFRTLDGFSLEPARALVDLHEAGVALVLVSGRTRLQLIEACRIFGADGFIGELGSLIGWDNGRSHEVLAGAMPAAHDGRTPAEVIEAQGLPAALFARYPGRLEYHSPWHTGHEGDVMLRGRVPVDEVEAFLAGEGFGWLRLHDNGVLPERRPTTLSPEVVPAHVYHLMPDGLSKGLAVARDLARRGLSPAEAIAIGDSASDLTMAEQVSRFFLTANGLRHPDMQSWVDSHGNVTVCEGAVGLGWVEAVRWALRTMPV
jgi:hydroxymethylpyrimidine pyrophosphatase-like HAD family hydrolase